MLDQDVQSRVDAYRGNPQALQQKYSVSKDLLDLMALQKLTKEKEAAARELQMSMAAQQGQPGTIREQLEQKALGITQQELAQQQGKLMQQQQQQQNMHQLAQSGIAQNPTPNMEGGPGFASGGIIAFAGGTEVLNPLEEKLKTENLELNKGTRTTYSPDVQNYVTQKREADIAASNAKQRQVPAYMQDAVRATNQGAFPTPAPIAPAAQAEAPINVSSGASGFPMTAAPGIPSALPERREQPAEYKVPEKVRAVRPAPVPPVGIATPQAAPTAPQAAAPQQGGDIDYNTLLQQAFNESRENPKLSRQELLEQFRVQNELTPEEKADRKQYQDMLRARHAALSDPEELRREKLKQALLGMAGASNAGIALARGAAAGQNYEAGRNAEGLKMLEQLNSINEGETSARRKALETAYGLAGREAESVRGAEGTRRAGEVNNLGAGARNREEIAGRDRQLAAQLASQLTIHKLDKSTAIEVANINASAHRDLAVATREATSQAQREAAVSKFIQAQATAERVLVSRYNVQIKAVQDEIKDLSVLNRPTTEAQARLKVLTDGLELDRQKLLSSTQAMLSQAQSGSEGWGAPVMRPAK